MGICPDSRDCITIVRGKKIPEMMKGLGKGVKEFKDASNENKSNDTSSDEVEKK